MYRVTLLLENEDDKNEALIVLDEAHKAGDIEYAFDVEVEEVDE